MIKKIFSNSLVYGIAPQIPLVANIIVLPLITPHLTKEDFGIRGIILSYMGLIVIFQSLGLRMIYSNAYFHFPCQFKWAWRQLLGFELIWNAIFQIFMGLLLYVIIPEEANSNKILIIFLIIIPQLLFAPLANLAKLRYQLEEKPMPIAIRSVVFGMLGVGITFYLIRVQQIGYIGWFWSTFWILVLSNLSYFYSGLKEFNLYPIFNFKWRFIKRSLKVSLPAIPHYYSTYLLDSSDRIVMDNLNVSTTDIGKYSISYSVSGKFAVLGTALGLAVGPTYRQLLKEKNEYALRELTIVLQVLFFVITFLIAIWLKEIMMLLIRGHNINELVIIGILILMSYNYRPMYLQNTIRYIYFEHTKSLWKISFGAGLINVILNIVLIPIFGFKVAALTTFISLIYMGYSGFFFKEYRKISKLPYYPEIWILAQICLTALSIWIVNFNFFIKIIISVVLVLTLLVLYHKNKHKLNII